MVKNAERSRASSGGGDVIPYRKSHAHHQTGRAYQSRVHLQSVVYYASYRAYHCCCLLTCMSLPLDQPARHSSQPGSSPRSSWRTAVFASEAKVRSVAKCPPDFYIMRHHRHWHTLTGSAVHRSYAAQLYDYTIHAKPVRRCSATVRPHARSSAV